MALELTRPERKDGFTVDLVEDLCEAGVEGGGSTEDAFEACDFEDVGVVLAGGEEEEQEGEGAEDND